MNPNFIHSGEGFYQVSTRQKNLQSIRFTHEDLVALLEKYDYHFSSGDVVAGTVFKLLHI